MSSTQRFFAPPSVSIVVQATIALAMLLLASCSSSDSQDVEATSVFEPESGSIPTVDLSRTPVADGDDPSTSAGAASDFLDCRTGIAQGIAAADFGIPAGTSDPDISVERFVLEGPFVVPTSGYVAAGEDEGRRLYTHSVEGEAKVAIVVADSSIVAIDADGRWVIEAFASCDPSEFDASLDASLPFDIWVDSDGERMPSSVIKTNPGDDHCGQESGTFLSVEGALYVADPRRVLGDTGAGTDFDDDASMPVDAIDSGYRQEGRQLWFSRDGSVAYVVIADRVEAWPLATTPPECA